MFLHLISNTSHKHFTAQVFMAKFSNLASAPNLPISSSISGSAAFECLIKLAKISACNMATTARVMDEEDAVWDKEHKELIRPREALLLAMHSRSVSFTGYHSILKMKNFCILHCKGIHADEMLSKFYATLATVAILKDSSLGLRSQADELNELAPSPPHSTVLPTVLCANKLL